MNGQIVVIFLLILITIPPFAQGQNIDRITLLDTFGNYNKGESIFIFGQLAKVLPDSFLLVQIVNPNQDFCQIQQLKPLSNGFFITESIPLDGRICGITGDYEIKIFYGEYTKTSSFSVATDTHVEKTEKDYHDSAVTLVSQKIASIKNFVGNSFPEDYINRLENSKAIESEKSMADLKNIFVELWFSYYDENEIFDLDPTFRFAIESSLSNTAELVEKNSISFDIANSIDKQIVEAIFYSQIGDNGKTIQSLNDAFFLIANVDPIKVDAKQSITFGELEDILLNMMKKTSSIMNRNLKEEIAFIFARGTGPLYANELNDMLDILTKSRYLDNILRRDDPLYRLIQTEWEFTRDSLKSKDNIDEFLELKEKVDKLHTATLLLRNLDKVDRFIADDNKNNSDLAILIKPNLDELLTELELATSVDSIILQKQEILDMKNVIEISSRLTKTIEVSKEANIQYDLVSNWESLLKKVGQAESIPEILQVISEFDQSLKELREKRNPLSILKFEYEVMKSKAELQADYKNLFTINNALKIINIAENMERENPSVNKIDRIEVLLAWASSVAPKIKNELDSYSKDVYKVRAGDILQRAKSLENLIDLGIRNNRFLPGYNDFADSMKSEIDVVRELVIATELDVADDSIRQLFLDWRTVSQAYAEDPYGSEVGYNVDELTRIEYREKIESYSNMVSQFYNADFAPHSAEFAQLTDKVSESVDYGNFIDAEYQLDKIRDYLSENLVLINDKIIYEIEYDSEKDIWIIEGAVDKSIMDRRENLYLTVYDMTGKKHSALEFTDTKHGEFYTQWNAPAETGMYVVMLQYQNSKASQIVNVDKTSDISYSSTQLDSSELGREFGIINSFINEFGGSNFEKNKSRFEPIIKEIQKGLMNKNFDVVKHDLKELEELIERYLPVRSRSAVIETNVDNGQLFISGAVQKTISFNEDLFVDIYDQDGNLVDEISIKDSSSGHFNEAIPTFYKSGWYVAKLQYHDLIVTDFFSIKS